MTAGILLLAAGNSRRFGDADKREALLAGETRLLDATLSRCDASGLPLQVCLGVNDQVWLQELSQRGVKAMTCSRSPEGMGATLSQGVAQVSGWQAALVMLADMPRITPETLRAVAEQAAFDRIVVPVFKGQRGHPVAFGARFFGQLRTLTGDVGGRQLLRAHARAVMELAVEDEGVCLDVDTPAQLAALNARN